MTTLLSARLVPAELRKSSALAEIVFASTVQPSERPPTIILIVRTCQSLSAHKGVGGCVAHMCAEFGDHPDIAAQRMQWALSVVRLHEWALRVSLAATLIARRWMRFRR